MKKVTDYLKSYVLIIFGALLFLYYLNYLSYKGKALAIGIFAVVISAFYLVVGVAQVLADDKIPTEAKKAIDALSVGLFAIFIFVSSLLVIIDLSEVMGPTAWTIGILTMVASLALAVVYFASEYAAQSAPCRLTRLVSAIFALALLLNLLFDVAGDSIVLGNLDVLLVVIYGVFTYYLFGSVEKNAAAVKPAEPEKTETTESAPEAND